MEYQKFFSIANKMGFSKIQVTEESINGSEVSIVNGNIKNYSDRDKTTFTIKVCFEGKTEIAISDYLDASILELLLVKIKNTDSNYEDEYIENKKNNIAEKDSNISISEEIKLLKQLEEQKKKFKLVESIESKYSEVYQKTRIINNMGVDISTDCNLCSLYIETSGNNDGKRSCVSKKILSSSKEDIDINSITIDVLDKTQRMTEKDKLKAGKYDIIFDNSVISDIISHLQYMLSAREIRLKKSCLENMLNKKVFSDKLSIVEEPLSKQYPGYTIFDKEGNETSNKTIVENGKIKTYLYDNKEAKISNKKSTGNFYIDIGTRNMYVKPGNSSLKDLFKQLNNGIYITDYMGSSGTAINDSTGNISLQIFGFIIENGEIKKGFHPSIMTTNIFELLSNIETIGNDLEFSSVSVGAPSILVKDIYVSS